MIETVFALILTLNGNMIEHVYKDNLSDCLKSKRIAQNEVNPERVVFSCKKVKQMKFIRDLKVEVEINGTGTHKYRYKRGPNKGKVTS